MGIFCLPRCSDPHHDWSWLRVKFLGALICAWAADGEALRDSVVSVAQLYIDQFAEIPHSIVRAQAHDVPGYGVSMVATEQIRAGEAVLFAPNPEFSECCVLDWHLNFSYKVHADLHRDLPDVREDDAWCITLLDERALGNQSRFHKMLEVGLPREPERSFSLNPGDDEYEVFRAWNLTEGPVLFHDNGAMYDWKVCADRLRRLERIDPSWAYLRQGQTADDAAKWSLSAWQTRSFWDGLNPAFSFFNHHWGATNADFVSYSMRGTEYDVFLQATRDIEKGEQIFISYTNIDLSNVMLLAQYGFMIPDNPILENPGYHVLRDTVFEELLLASYSMEGKDLKVLDEIDELDSMWRFRIDQTLVISDELLLQLRKGAAKMDAATMTLLNTYGWEDMMQFYTITPGLLQQRTEHSADEIKAIRRLVSADRYVCSEWVKVCAELKQHLQHQTEHHMRRLRTRTSDVYASSLATVTADQISFWGMCVERMGKILEFVESFSKVMHDMYEEL